MIHFDLFLLKIISMNHHYYNHYHYYQILNYHYHWVNYLPKQFGWNFQHSIDFDYYDVDDGENLNQKVDGQFFLKMLSQKPNEYIEAGGFRPAKKKWTGQIKRNNQQKKRERETGKTLFSKLCPSSSSSSSYCCDDRIVDCKYGGKQNNKRNKGKRLPLIIMVVSVVVAARCTAKKYR